MAIVAKSYQTLEQIGDTYMLRNKMYIKVRTNSGEIKQVRAYTPEEWAKYNPGSPIPNPNATRKELLGFANGYIALIKGDTYENLEWLKQSPATYNRCFGWYFPSTVEDITLPEGMETEKLSWNEITNVNGMLLPEDKMKEIVESKIYDAGDSEFQGDIGERIDFDAVCTKVIPLENDYGVSNLHIFEDGNGNTYSWITSSRTLEEGTTYHVRGTVKDHKIYHNQKSTVLTRCNCK